MFFENDNIDKISSLEFMSILDEDPATYTGVKSIQEEQTIPDTDKKDNINNINNNIIENNENKENENKENENIENKNKENLNENENNENINKENLNENEDDKENDMKDISIESYESERDSSSECFSEEGGNTNKKKIEKVNTVFEWDEGGKSVYVTGSFCNWKQFFIMTKNEEGVFSLTLNLPRGIHEYKFKVDKEWKCSERSPKHDDGEGNINNYIDTRRKKEKNNNKEKSNRKSLSCKSNNNSDDPNKKLDFNRRISFMFPQEFYSTYFPLKEEMKNMPHKIPGLYKIKLELNKEKDKDEKEFYNENEEYSINTSDLDLKKILSKGELRERNEIFNRVSNLMNIFYNHLHSKETILKKTTISSITSRYRFKNTTFLYYKPRTKIKKMKNKSSRSLHVKRK